MVSYSHELSQRWVPKDGVVRQANVSDIEVDELGVVVVALFESYREADLPYQGSGAVSNSYKGLVG